MADIREVYVDYAGYQTYCKIVGEGEPGKKPLLVLHGGPGGSHDSLLTYAELADRYGRQVVFYDQIGGGRSAVPHQEDEFYCNELWIDELFRVREALGLSDVHLFGNSWGGMVGLMALLRDESGVSSFVINSAPVCIDTWLTEANRLIGYLPQEMQDAIAEAERTGNYDTPEAGEAMAEYLRRHVMGCSPEDYPQFLLDSMQFKSGESYHVMQGASEFVVTGKMAGWDIRDQVGRITVPCMFLSGTDDECTPYVAKECVDAIPGCEWTLIQGAPHLANVTHPEECLRVVEDFLERHE